MHKQTEESKVITAYKKHGTMDIPFDLITGKDHNDKYFAYLVLPGHIRDDYGNHPTDLFQFGYSIQASYAGLNKVSDIKETLQNCHQNKYQI